MKKYTFARSQMTGGMARSTTLRTWMGAKPPIEWGNIGSGIHPPKNMMLTSSDTISILRYSPMKNRAYRMPEYSVANPATSSDSASGRSKGTRLVSATPDTKSRKNATGPIGRARMNHGGV